MNTIPKEWLEFLREQFPEGSQIKIKETAEPHPPFALGEQGKLEQIDNNGCFHVRMSGGILLTLVLGEDRFSVSPPAPTMMKLYMPLTADLYTRNEYGEMEEDSTLLDGRSLRAYEGEILRALINSRMPEESESGIMHWYGKRCGFSKRYFLVLVACRHLTCTKTECRKMFLSLIAPLTTIRLNRGKRSNRLPYIFAQGQER